MPHTASPLARPGHIGLNVSDIDRSVSFYKDLLGFQVLLEGGAGDRKFAFLGDGGKPVLTLWQQSTGSFDKRRPGLHHFAFEVGAVDEVRRLEAKLHARGIHFHYEGIVPHAEGAASGACVSRRFGHARSPSEAIARTSTAFEATMGKRSVN